MSGREREGIRDRLWPSGGSSSLPPSSPSFPLPLPPLSPFPLSPSPLLLSFPHLLGIAKGLKAYTRHRDKTKNVEVSGLVVLTVWGADKH